MRPVKLNIQAFGPFTETEEIDFTRLGLNPLFLINGPTGSGKSSILDAICFVLYGQTSGNEREAAQMRCDSAKENLLTEVSLDFALGEKAYRIKRLPTQEKPKARGDGTTVIQTSAQLWELKPDGEDLIVPKSATAATRKVEELTGLNVEQFRQVMVLPQGKFRDFLMADSNQREAIFSKLFQTQIYKRLENILKDRASSIRKKVEGLRNQILGILQSADINTENEVQDQLKTLAPELKFCEQQKKSASEALTKADKAFETGKLLTKAFQSLAKTRKELKTLESQKNNIEDKKNQLNRAKTAQNIKHILGTLTKVNQSRELLEKELSSSEQLLIKKQKDLYSAKEALTIADTALKPLDTLKEQALELRKLIPRIDQLIKAVEQTNQTKKAAESAQHNFTHNQTQLDTAIESIKICEARITKLKKDLPDLSEKQIQRGNLLLLGKQRARLDKLLIEQNNLRDEQKICQKAFMSAGKDTTKHETHLKTVELEWHSNQAVLLAAELKPDTPCPVCGSKDHPAPAARQGETSPVTKQDIDLARELLTKLQKKHTRAQSRVTKIETQLNSNEKAINEQKNELGKNQDKSTEQLHSDYEQIESEIKQLIQLQKEQTRLEADLQKMFANRENAEMQLETTRTAQQKAQQNYSLAQQSEQHIEKELPEKYSTPGVLDSSITVLEGKITTITQAHQKAQDSFNSTNQIVAQTAATLEEQKKQHKTIVQDQTEAKNNWKTALEKSVFNNEDDYLSALLPEADQQRLQEDIQNYTNKLSGCKASLNQQKKQLAEKQAPDMEQLQTNCDRLKAASDQAFDDWKKIDNRSQQLIDVQTKLDKAHKSNQAFEEEYKVYGTLSDVANGQTGNKISLQRFVLSVLLDDVLIEASHRLQTMSKGRYLLVRKEDRAKGNKASGLELEVEDAYTGKTRSVATLSGGESFMAALSLALGLSDVVQAYAGGIKLDTLFIDEGFGSLDQESLDLAIRTLIDLQSSGRMIGIISHVSELREQMALRIDIQSSSKGSKVTVSA